MKYFPGMQIIWNITSIWHIKKDKFNIRRTKEPQNINKDKERRTKTKKGKQEKEKEKIQGGGGGEKKREEKNE